MTGKNHLQKRQEEVEEVKVIMLENFNKAEERKDKLSDLEERAEDLREKGKVFEKTTRTVMEQKKAEYECLKLKNRKCTLGAIGVIAVVIIGAVVFVVMKIVL